MRVRSLQVDRAGIEGLPLRLLIVALLMSLAFPLLLGAIQGYSEDMIRLDVEREMKRVEDAAISALLGGPGSVRVLDITFSIGNMEVGGPSASSASHSIRYSGGGIQTTRLVTALPIEIRSAGNGTLLVPAPGGKLKLECVSHPSGTWIVAGVVQ